MALTDWVQTAAAIYFAWQQNRIFKRQNEIIAAQSERTAVQSDSSWTLRIRRYWPTLAMLVLIAITAYDIYDRHHDSYNWSDLDKLEPVASRTFRNETVVLDGKHFSQPTFERVTFIYNGLGGFAMEDAHFIPSKDGTPSWTIVSRNNAVKETIKLENALLASSGCQSRTEDRGPVQMEGLTPPK